MNTILPKLFLGGLAIAVVLAIALRLPKVLRRKRWTVDGPEPRCRGCGYIICQGAARTCTECGGDLRTLGAMSLSLSRPTYPLALIIGGGVMWGAVALVLGAVLAMYIPPVFARYDATKMIPSGVPATQPRGSPDEIQVTACGRRAIFHYRPDEFYVTWWVYRDSGTHWAIDARQSAQGKWTITSGPGGGKSVSESDDTAAALRIVTLAGLDPHTHEAKDLAAKLAETIKQFRRGDLPRTDTRVGAGPGAGWQALDYENSFTHVLMICFLIWLPPWWFARRALRRRWRANLRFAMEQEQATLNHLGVPGQVTWDELQTGMSCRS